MSSTLSGDTPVIEKERPRLVEELLTSRTYHKDNDPIVVNKTTFFDKILSSSALLSPEHSKELPRQSTDSSGGRARVGTQSIDSVTTDVLLQSTDEFMKAVHSFSSESEASSTNVTSSGGRIAAAKSTSTNRQSSSLRKSTADRLSSSNKLNNLSGYEVSTPRSTGTSKESPSMNRRSVADSVTAR